MKRALVSSFFGLLLVAAPASAASNAAGSFAYVAADSDNVEKAIETTIAPMNFVVRAVAKGRLQKVNMPYTHVTIALKGSQIAITTPGRDAITTGNGSTIKWTRPEDGEKLDVTIKQAGNAIEETFASPDGKRVNVFTPSADGKKLTCAVTVTSSRLPGALTYKLVYKRDK